jgi:hypothetical protein
MAVKKPHYGRSFASDRALIEMAKTKSLDAIVQKLGRTPESILKTAKRLGISTKGWRAKLPQ